MTRRTILRICFDIVIAVSILNGWWPVAFLAGLLGAWMFPYFIEIIIAGCAYDALFGAVPEMGISGYAGSIGSISLFALMSIVKKSLRK